MSSKAIQSRIRLAIALAAILAAFVAVIWIAPHCDVASKGQYLGLVVKLAGC